MQVPFNDLSTLWAPHQARLAAVLTDVAARGWFLLGPATERFERDFAAVCAAPHCIGVGNGTDALELALRGVGVGAGDRVVLTANAGGYSSTACRAIGAVPVYADVLMASGLIDPASAAAGADGARAVVVTHLYGNVADVEQVRRVLPGVPVVEDCAQAHGATLDGRPVGGLGDVAAFSFYPTKNLGALGDAGAVVTGDESVAARVRALRRYGWSERYQVELPGGRNSRIDELQAAVLAEFLPDLAAWNRRRQEIHDRYVAAAGDRLSFLRGSTPGSSGVVHLSVLRHPDRAAFIQRMKAAGVQCEVHFPRPDHHQPGLRRDGEPVPQLTCTELLAAEVVSLPCHPGLTDTQVEHVAMAAGASA